MAKISKDKDAEFKREMDSYKAALELKEEGNTLFKKGDLKSALKSYSRMLIHLGMKPTFALSSLGGASAAAVAGMDMVEDEEAKHDDPSKKLQKDADLLRITCFNNISAVYAKMGSWKKSLEKAHMVLELDGKNPKALFRVGVANRHLKEYAKAKESLLTAQKIKDSAAIRNELRRVEAGLAAERAKNDKRFRRAFKKQAAANKSKKESKEDTKELAEQKENKEDAVNDKENIKNSKVTDIDQGTEKEKINNQADEDAVKSCEAGAEAVTNTNMVS